MLAPEDRKAIEGLFDRLGAVAGQNPDRDADAVALIDERIAAAPSAPYYMAQTVLVQEHALAAAQDRIAELEANWLSVLPRVACSAASLAVASSKPRGGHHSAPQTRARLHRAGRVAS